MSPMSGCSSSAGASLTGSSSRAEDTGERCHHGRSLLAHLHTDFAMSSGNIASAAFCRVS